MYNNLSFVIPFFKSGRVERAILLDFVYMRIKTLYKDAEIILGVSDEEIFNKASTVNIGVKNATNDILVILDADIIFDKKLIDEALIELETTRYVVPYQNCRHLLQQNTSDILKMNHDADVSTMFINLPAYVHENAKGGINIIRRADFEYIKGFDENFKGWGNEDEAFYYKASTILGCKHMKNDIYHLYHLPCVKDENSFNNIILHSEIVKMDKEELIKYYNIDLK